MGSFIFKQPNGLYGRFSSVVDCVTDINMTKKDYINMCMKKAKREAEDVLKNHLGSYENAIEWFINNNMTEQKFEEVKQKMNLPKDIAKYEEV